jgi:hypothetical protein
MHYYYFWGVAVIYIGFLFLLFEVCADPWVLNCSLTMQIVLIAFVLLFVDIFSIGVVAAQAPITFQSYAMRNGDYSPGVTIAGMAWDSHFTDLRVVLTNPTDDDYENLDIDVQPDQWTYKAALLDSPGCDLSPLGGNMVSVATTKGGATSVTTTPVGPGFDAHDNAGGVFAVMATEFGYRIRCAKLSQHLTAKIVFAVVRISPELLRQIGISTNGLSPGKKGVEIAELAGVKSPFDILGSKPLPLTVQLSGVYTRKFKPFKITTIVVVGNGD